ncbi:MAG: phosphoglucosamine mutase [Microthrixaceae bacterium]
MTIRFGTDGVRGLVNSQITAEVALAIGRATARVFAAERVLIGRDTRLSGTMLESAVAAGVTSEGVDAVLLGVVPTPAVAVVSARDSVPGVVISASHNPFHDNGLKVFAPGGRKLSDDEQSAVEAAIAEVVAGAPPISGGKVGVVQGDPSGLDAYADAVLDTLEGRDLSGLQVVLDCANGANSVVAARVMRSLGAAVEVIFDRPDGSNINAGCGSTHPEALRQAVRDTGADIGLAFDGDADRLVAVDSAGEVVDGDHIIALCALDLAARGQLANDTVVVTVMSNLGFMRAMRTAGIRVEQTAVGDRYVLEALAQGGHTLGGEQSGHIIFADRSTTGDGLLAGVTLADLVKRSGLPLSDLAADAMTRLPQVLLNVAVDSPMPDVVDRIAAALAAAETELAEDGRILVRPSGTEPVVRVMVEATDPAVARGVAEQLADEVRAAAAG